MEEIKVGEYVRTKKGIHRIYKMNGSEKVAWYGRYFIEKGMVAKKDIVKHSPNIIDLIEVGDYVNGERVIETHNRANDDGEKVILTENYNAWTDDGIVSNKYIKTIVTREQFKGVMYEVK